nr:proton-conducting transporter membrane subunit [bacterium]
MTLDIPQASEWMALIRFSSPLIAVFAASCAALVLSALAGDDESPSAPWVVIAGLAASFAVSWKLWPEAEGARIAMVSLDRLSLVAWMLLALSGLAASALSIGGSRSPGGKLRGDFFALIGFCVFGMGVLASAGDLVSILIGLETMSLAAYSLAGYTKSRATSLEGALKYFLMGAFATAFFAMGVAFIIGSAGTTDLALLSERASEVATGEGRAFFLFGCAMAAIGFAFKVAAVPFHAWAPDAYEGAPTPVTQLMATGVKAAAFFAFARFSLSVAAHAGLAWQHLVFALSVATMVLGNLAAIRQ